MNISPKQHSRTDRRIVRTRKAIMTAFDKLIMDHHIDKITVSAIAREADIDRKTFYLHYTSVEDLVHHKTEQYLEGVFAVIRERGLELSPEERVHLTLEKTNHIMVKNRDVFAHGASNLSTDQIMELFTGAIYPALDSTGLTAQIDEKLMSEFSVRARLRYAIAGSLALYRQWLTDDEGQPIEAVSQVIEESVVEGTLAGNLNLAARL